MTLLLETGEKVAMPLFRMGKHEIFTSISGEIVGKNFARGVISDAHVIGNDVRAFFTSRRSRGDPAPCVYIIRMKKTGIPSLLVLI